MGPKGMVGSAGVAATPVETGPASTGARSAVALDRLAGEAWTTARVALVGAGPGDPGLATQRAVAWLERADVVVYDRLANPALLDRAPATARCIYVGKSPQHHALRQTEINQLLVDLARAGDRVVRLKGGDPFVFGRGGEEAEALAAAAIPFEVVPGVTSAIAAAAYAGIPVTHRGVATSFGVVTGHEEAERDSRVNWAGLATGPDTLLLLMGVEQLPSIVERLLAGGRPGDTPAAMVEWGTWPRQRTVVATLGTIVERARQAGLGAPAVTIVGEVVRLRERLRWFDRRPLFGRRVLVTRPREQSSELCARLRDLGAETIECPAIRTIPLDHHAALDQALPLLSEYDWVVFTSANAVRVVLERLRATGRDARAFGTARLGAVGPATAKALAAAWLRADLVPEPHTTAAMAAALAALVPSGGRVLHPCAASGCTGLPSRLAATGARVDSIPVYRTVREVAGADELRRQLLAGAFDAVTFTSPSTVESLVGALGLDDLAAWPPPTRIIAIGPATANAIRALGLPIAGIADEQTMPSLVATLVRLLAGDPLG